MSIEEHLLPGEKLISQHGLLYASSQRIIHYAGKNSAPQIHALPYDRLTGIRIVRRANHKLMMVGTIVSISAAYASTMLSLFFGIFAIPAGVAMVLLGSVGRDSHYQIEIRDMTEAEEQIWQIKHKYAQHFISTLRTIVPSIEEKLD
jgi:uncharacterized membrane protein